MKKSNLFFTFLFISSLLFGQKNIFSLNYSNQLGINQFNSIQNESHGLDQIWSAYSYKNFLGVSFERQISEKRNLWINFSLNVWNEEFGIDYYYLFSDPSQDPFDFLTQGDLDSLRDPVQKRSKSSIQMVDLQLSIKKSFQTKWWGVEFQPELGIISKSDFGLISGFRYASFISKPPIVYYANLTQYQTNFPTNHHVFWFGSLNLNKTFRNKFRLGLDVTYIPRIQFDYTFSTVINIGSYDENGVGEVFYFEEINKPTKAKLTYDLLRFGFTFGYKF